MNLVTITLLLAAGFLGVANALKNQFLCQYFSDRTYKCYTKFGSLADPKASTDRVFNLAISGEPVTGTWTNDDRMFRTGDIAEKSKGHVGTCTFGSPADDAATCKYAAPQQPCKESIAACTIIGNRSGQFIVRKYTGKAGGQIRDVTDPKVYASIVKAISKS